MSTADQPLSGRVALVTGVSRSRGIGFAVAHRLGQLGASLFLHGFTPYDHAQPWGVDAEGTEVLATRLQAEGMEVSYSEADFHGPSAPKQVIDSTVRSYRHIDILVANHAHSTPDQRLATVTTEEIDDHLIVNARAALLLVQAFAAQHDGREGGRIVFLISAQEKVPMERELAYSASKAAVNNLAWSFSGLLMPKGITVNTVNPGGTDTGWASKEQIDRSLPAWPHGRWGEPDDAARLITWLCTDDAKWVTGQTINSDGGWRPWSWEPGA